MARAYYQTTLLSPEQAEELSIKAISQEACILSFLRQYPNMSVTAEAILSAGILARGTPITSVRRALTNLCHAGKVCRTGEKEGQYGQPIGQYRAVTP